MIDSNFEIVREFNFNFNREYYGIYYGMGS